MDTRYELARRGANRCFLLEIGDPMIPYVKNVLIEHSDDEEWVYWIFEVLINHWNTVQVLQIQAELIKISQEKSIDLAALRILLAHGMYSKEVVCEIIQRKKDVLVFELKKLHDTHPEIDCEALHKEFFEKQPNVIKQFHELNKDRFFICNAISNLENYLSEIEIFIGELPVNNVKVLHYDAFSPYPNKGNPAGVVLNANHLSDSEMQSIAHKVGFNETVFVVQSDVADLRLKYFTPGHEINLCGHATMASLYALKTTGILGEVSSVKIETNVGVLPIQFSMDNNNHLLIKMKQDHPKFIEFNGDRAKLAHAIGLTVEELEEDMPIVYGCTGVWTLLVPIKSIDSFSRMKPISSLFPEILKELPNASVHPFVLQSFDPNALMHARHFSSPFSGTVEDPVTGTASGVMGAYYLKYIDPHLGSIQFDVEQGQEIGRDGKVNVEVSRLDSDKMDVFISGTAVYVKELEI